MKKIIIAILLIILLIMPMGLTVAQASTDSQYNAKVQEAAQVLDQFVVANSSRVYGEEGEREAAKYIADIFTNCGITDVDLVRIIDSSAESYNVVATIDVPTSSQAVLIGAHYDAIGQGASDNASGVTALFMLAQMLVDNVAELNCDVILVAFCGEEFGLVGSQDYVNRGQQSTNQSVFNSIELMINIDNIANGDNLYVYGQPITSGYIDTLISNAPSGLAKVEGKPLGVGLNFALDVYGYGYYEMAQNSDQTPFALAGIATAIYYSGTYDWLGNFSESTESKYNTMNTSKDTLGNLRDGYAERIVAVSSSIYTSLTDDDSTAVLLTAQQQLLPGFLFNSLYTKIACGVLLLVVIIIGYNYYKKLVKKAIMGVAESKGNNRMFGSPDINDVFDLGTEKNSAQKSSDKSNGVDASDIFDLGDD